MNWLKVALTGSIVLMWVVMYFTRHSLTQKGADLYNLRWSDNFKRKYANAAVVVAVPFYAFLIWFLWKVVPE